MYYQNYEDYMRQVLGYPINDPNIYETYDYRNIPNYSDTYNIRNQTNYMSNDLSDEEVENLYPDIYQLVNPMVCKVCETNTQPITRELVEKMTDEVYMAIEDTSTVVNVRVETPKTEEISNTKKENLSRSKITPSRESSTRNNLYKETSTRTLTPREETKRERNRLEKNISTEKATTSRETTPSSKIVNIEKEENRKQTREVVSNQTRQSNSILRDLIKILILNQIFGGNRPPVRPPRPPFPGGPGMPPPPRPPFSGVHRPPMGPGPVRPPVQPRDTNGYSDYLKF